MTLIFTKDDSQYKVDGCIIMHNSLDYPPTAPDTTYLYYPHKLNLTEVLEWIPYIRHLLVVVVDNKPTIPAQYADVVVIHPSLKEAKESHFKAIEPVFRWGDRGRAMKAVQGVPIPLFLAFLRANRMGDIDTWRRLSQVQYFLPDEFAYAIFAYSVQPSANKMEWPKKSEKKQPYENSFFRMSDIYADIISAHAEDVVNAIRVINPTELPKGVPKKQTNLTEWL